MLLAGYFLFYKKKSAADQLLEDEKED